MNDYPPSSTHSTDSFLKNLRRKRLLGSIAVSAVVIVVLLASIVMIVRLSANKKQPKVAKDSVVKMWLDKDYAGISAACDSTLEAYPLDPFYLTFKGFSAFYLALAESDGEKRSARIDEAIFALRKALIDEKAPLQSETSYVLGKAYYHKGSDYYDEAITYLTLSIDNGYEAADTWEYLALAAQATGLREQSLRYFDKALALKPDSPELILVAAKMYSDSGDNKKAESLTIAALSGTTDEYLAERCNFMLGELYRTEKRYDEALACYSSIKEKNPQSADAWYYEGLVLMDTGDLIRARASWRKAVYIDPMHANARQKLSERS